MKSNFILFLGVFFLSSINAQKQKKIIETCSAVTPQFTCPEGFSLAVNNICYKRDIIAKEIECLNGYSRCSDGCCLVVPYDARRNCPVDTVFQENTQNCLRLLELPLEQECPKNFLYCGPGICCFKKRAKANVSCPTGTYFTGSACEATQIIDAEVGCPVGYTATNRLPDYIKKETVPLNENLVDPGNIYCVKTNELYPQFECPPQSYSDSVSNLATCTKRIAIEIMGKCKTGYIFDTKRAICIWEVQANPISFSCDPNYTLNKDQLCIGEKSIGKPTIICPAGYLLNQNNKCILEEITEAQLYCPEGYAKSVDNSECEQLIQVNKIPVCPETHVLFEGNRCVIGEVITPVIMCKNGVLQVLNKEIKLTLTERKLCKNNALFLSYAPSAKFDTECKTGSYTQYSCKVTQTYEAVINCPKNTTICPEGCCSQQITEGTFKCPMNTIPYPDKCVAQEFVDVTYDCPPGYTQNLDKCLEVKVGNMSMNCPPGYVANANGMCEQLLTKDIQPICPEGYFYSMSSANCVCVTIESPIPNIVPAYSNKKKDIKVTPMDSFKVWASLSPESVNLLTSTTNKNTALEKK